jgi:nucleoside-diphosphate-sugar epimerase
MKTVAITGASGFIGKNLCNYFLAKGWRVKALQRNIHDGHHPNINYYKYSLNKDIDVNVIEGCDLMIHCAFQKFDMQNKDAAELNIHGTRKLLDACHKKKVKFIFLSTLSAHPGAKSEYGKHKLELEKIFNKEKDIVLKLGLVIGPAGGLFSEIAKVIDKSRFIPLIDGGKQPIQTVYINDLCEMLEHCFIHNIKGIYKIAEEEPIVMKDLYQMIALNKGKSLKFFYVPSSLILIILKTLEALNLGLKISSESLVGLRQLKAFDTASDLKKIGFRLKPASESIKLALSNGI